MRLFIAIELPDGMKTTLSRLRADIPGARWVPVEQIHLTLAFLGEVEELSVERLTVELAQIQIPAFDLSLSGTGCFPNPGRPRVLWVGVESKRHLLHLGNRVHDAVLACGIPQEERPFSPHITLARLNSSPSRELQVFLEQKKAVKLSPFSVREFILFQSRLSHNGAVHIPIRSFRLATGGASSEC